MNTNDLKIELANLIFPDAPSSLDTLFKRYPKRQLNAHQEVTRFAPSPTGHLHTGSLFTALISYKIAKQSKGIFFVRIEDTDQKRKIEGSSKALLEQLKKFNIYADELEEDDKVQGQYGPYYQSERASIYHTVVKYMIAQGLAYPCFMTTEELAVLRKQQEEIKVITGYYGSYAKYRVLPIQEAINKIKQGIPYVIRFKSNGDHRRHIIAEDLIRGKLKLTENDVDIVLIKSDGLPTYHLAHVVDDYLMGTTVITRGEEWLSSYPIHIQLFKALNWPMPKFAHMPLIMKLDEQKKRKLSKRYDEEASVDYFFKQGYPIEAVIEYLYILANTNYEEWRIANPELSRDKFEFKYEKMSLDGALFDIQKVDYLSKELIATLNLEQLFSSIYQYAQQYDKQLLKLIERDPNFFKKIINIERDIEKPRKDFVKYKDIYDHVKYFYDDYYQECFDVNFLNQGNWSKILTQFLNDLINQLHLNQTPEQWFQQLTNIAKEHCFAPKIKEFKLNPSQYVGHVGDAAQLLRYALTGQTKTPNLYYIMKVLGIDECHRRIRHALNALNI
jgi:glutamyl-tRNA synthetase